MKNRPSINSSENGEKMNKIDKFLKYFKEFNKAGDDLVTTGDHLADLIEKISDFFS